MRPITVSPLMGDLPAERVTPSRPFYTCGVDYAGPYLIKDRTRTRTTTKGYMCLFVCFATKAVHIELAIDLSTNAFLNCLMRFISRRGLCQDIYSDNGTNFIGARNELRELTNVFKNEVQNQQIQDFLSGRNIQWHLIPPRAPHFGGLWEGAIKSAKYHVKRVIGETILTYEELYTMLTQVEAIFNSRPLSPLSTDPTDLDPLTPGHFLIGEALTAHPKPDVRDIQSNRLCRFQLIQQRVQHFWQRWQSEYLHQLQQRNKWRTSTPGRFGPGTLDNLPPLRWRLGRIEDIHPGQDKVTRVVTVRTADGLVKRPVTKVCLLPVDHESVPTTGAKTPDGRTAL
ncbi:uncharacterized protein LOC122400519 [Colletes gigas]|uniref:uncharacterized protein LOC122400519 n=1 Tax=Colletes gigas TaxID=935657 RepID=UPI001C9A9BDD|nr:uncharacterized protein LOC122400519 [Colletes gigas]